ncbi:hypothetical protein [Flavobacterium fluviatile]|uniref:hypothetical protein n=1 Tax=Flavobacterium fluviatile TaxID=1862387 RepID=UPI0013CFFCC1|nr:hypothetical protein [Flavobacterium fluviatile]
MNENVLRKERENVFKINHYYYLVESCLKGFFDNYVPVRVLEMNQKFIKFLDLLENKEYNKVLNHSCLTQFWSFYPFSYLFEKIGFSKLESNPFNINEIYVVSCYENDNNYIIHLIERGNKGFFIKKKEEFYDLNLEELKRVGEAFTDIKLEYNKYHFFENPTLDFHNLPFKELRCDKRVKVLMNTLNTNEYVVFFNEESLIHKKYLLDKTSQPSEITRLEDLKKMKGEEIVSVGCLLKKILNIKDFKIIDKYVLQTFETSLIRK